MKWTLWLSALLICCASSALTAAELRVRVAVFECDVTPEVGSPLAYDPMREATAPLHCKGLVWLPADAPPIVMCTVDWLGVANAAQDEFRQQLAEAVNTTSERVVVHALHQHDAPRCDLSAALVLDELGLAKEHFDVPFLRACFGRAAKAAREALDDAVPIESLGVARVRVQQVASNRRLLDPDGQVHATRYTACRDPSLRALPEGVIDPWLQAVLLRGPQGPVAMVSFYATHPQSYYRTGQANPDFPGMARNQRQRETGVFHLHFNGAGGNIGAGKYNDGAHENRQVLADRMADGMRQAWEQARQDRRSLDQLSWDTRPVRLPLGKHLQEAELLATLRDASTPAATRLNTAKKIALLRRHQDGRTIDVSRMSLGAAQWLFLPGELFVEYQLAAQALAPGQPVMLAAYGDYGPGYIGTKVAYPQGGYEVSQRASNVAPEVEEVLMGAMCELLQTPLGQVWASDFTDRQGTLP